MRKRIARFETCLIALAVGLNSHQSLATSWGFHPESELLALNIVFSNDRNFAAISGQSRGVDLWDIQANEKKRTLVESAGVSSLAFFPDNKMLVCGRFNGTASFWDVRTGEKMYSERDFVVGNKRQRGFGDGTTHLIGDYGGNVEAIAVSPDGRVIVGGSEKTFDVTPKESQPRSLNRDYPASFFRRYVHLGEVRARDAQTNKLIWTAKWGLDWPSSLAFSPDGSLLAAAGDGEVKIYDAKTGAFQRRLEGSFSDRCPIAFSPDGILLAGSNSEKAVLVSEVQSGKIKHTLEGHKGTIWSVAFSPDGKLVASASSDNTVRLCHTVTGKSEQVFKGLELRLKEDSGTIQLDRRSTALRAATFSHDGDEIFAVGLGYDTWGDYSWTDLNIAIQRWRIDKQLQE